MRSAATGLCGLAAGVSGATRRLLPHRGKGSGGGRRASGSARARVPGAESLRGSRVFRNTFHGGPEGVAALTHPMDA